MIHLILVRHGETQWNREHRLQGQWDTDLNEVGVYQARKVGEALNEAPIQAVYTSDLRRAQQTAREIIGKREIPCIPDPRWREASWGRWEGMLREEIIQGDAQAWEAYQTDPFRNPPPGGESFMHVQSRAIEALEAMVSSEAEGTLVVVTHGVTLKAIICHLLAMPREAKSRIYLPNGSMSLFRLPPDGPPRCYGVSLTDHLSGIVRSPFYGGTWVD